MPTTNSQINSPGEEILQEIEAAEIAALHKVLSQSLQETLEVMFFVDILEEDAESIGVESSGNDQGRPPADKYRVVVPFRGGRVGCLMLEIDAPLARYCHEGFQPCEDSVCEQDFPPPQNANPEDIRRGDRPIGSVQDSMRELANIVCGSMLSGQWPDLLFTVDEPSIVVSAWGHEQPHTTTCEVSTTEGSVVASLTLHPDKLTQVACPETPVGSPEGTSSH